MSLLRSHSVEVKTSKKSRFPFFRRGSSKSASDATRSDTPVTDSGYSSSQADANDQERAAHDTVMNGSPPSALPSPPLSRPSQSNDSTPTNDIATLNNRSSSRPSYRLPEYTIPVLQHGTHEDGLPTYSSTAKSSGSIVYQFIRSSPFAMIVTEDYGSGVRPESSEKYHISVGVNIWMPSCTVTTICRGGTEDGPLVAQLELGIIAGPATVIMGGQCRPLSSVIQKKSAISSSRTYHLMDGRSLRWRLHSDVWRAHFDTQEIASFHPAPPRRLIVQPTAQMFIDHIIVGLVILMREHLTPKAALAGEAPRLFNYSHHLRAQDE